MPTVFWLKKIQDATKYDRGYKQSQSRHGKWWNKSGSGVNAGNRKASQKAYQQNQSNFFHVCSSGEGDIFGAGPFGQGQHLVGAVVEIINH
jgi:hypothetical protein